MLVYITQDEPLSPLCPINAESSLRPAGPEFSVPDTPWTHTVPLSGSPPPPSARSSAADEMFPLNILRDLPVSQQTTLRSISLTTPVHVHTPIAHIGMICGDIPGEKVNGMELIRCLREAHSLVSRETGMQGAISFTQPVAPWLYGIEYQNPHTPDQQSGSGPLLENVKIWGLEPMSFGGYSVVHLVGEPPRMFDI